METLITVIHVLAALFMILVIIIQGGNSGGVGAAFGGGNSQGVFGASGAQSFLGKVTYAVAAIFMVTSISLSVIQGSSGKTGLSERLEQQAADQGAEESTTPEAAPQEEQK
ncbi:preprotein translocase subunit SecG [Pseudobacteriovorax antillogorgiicola]|uniref:Protein-export membrane protein SecG n=1 Tax=Pseudobacteriovorax antillogorgiicola TaxID=1513793 RepID=A0A1Y6B3C0_9BACT|nr:preprotein translocase subunit SecG [Pseudobacteriovorax antillogorgiicola]TCS59335.1 preprotein translocase subunit SecG [Pseudobacteriovorax antillogorgiicola]SME89232.1 preprotein translocase subunit SecG [Pseudobacteriovorax antillogorgiicola]